MQKGKFVCDGCGKEKPYGEGVGPKGKLQRAPLYRLL